MDAQTVRTALGTIQSNPTDEAAWQALDDAMSNSGGDLTLQDALVLIRAACERHELRGESDAVVRLLTVGATSAEGTEDEVALVNELATVLLEELFDGRRATELLASVVSRLGSETAMEARLKEIKSRGRSYKQQAKTYRSEAESAPDDNYRSAMLMRASEVEVCFAKKPAYAKVVEDLESSLRLDSGNGPATKLLEAIYRRQGDLDGVVRVLERAADRNPSHETRVAAGVRLARLHQHHFKDQAKAAAAYARVLESEPSHGDAMEFVTEYYSAEERWDELVRAYEGALKGHETAANLGDLLQVAMLHWKMRASSGEAEPWFERIAKIEPAHEGVLRFYREYKSELQDDAGLVQILQDARKSLAEDDERAAALDEEIAGKEGEQVGAQRLVEKYKSALRVDPDNEEARETLKNLYKQTQGHNALVELLRQDLERIPVEEYERRLAVLREIATVYRKYVKSDTALVGVLNQIVNLDGRLDEQDVDEVRELVGLYEKLSRPRDHLAGLKLLAEIVVEPQEKVKLYRQVGRQWLEQFSNVQHAMEAFAALHQLEPEDPEANERLEDLYRKRRSWKELFFLYEQRLERLEGEARVPLLSEMALLAAERLNKTTEALDYYRQILEIDGSREEILLRMEKLAERSKSWRILADVLERRLNSMDKDESRLSVLSKLGAVYSDHLDMPEEAIGTWRRVVEVQPGHPRAMRVLRDAYLKASRFDELETLYSEQNELEGLAEVLSTAADRNSNPEEKLDLSYRAAKVYEEGLGQAPRAIRSYERILSIDPNDRRAISRLLPLYEQEEKWARIPPLLEVLVELAEDEEARIGVYALLVDVAGTKLADKRGAVAYARRAFDAAPERTKALELLDGAVRSAGAWEEIVAALEARLVQLGGDGPHESQKELGSLAETPPPPSDVTSASGKKKRRRGKSKQGASVAQASSPSSEAPELIPAMTSEQRPVALRLCRVLGEELGRVDEAVLRLKALAKDAPHDSDVMNMLESLVNRDSRPVDTRWLFEHRMNHAENEGSRAEILRKWGAFEEGTGDAAAALARYNEALELASDHEPTLEVIVRLALAQNNPARAAEVLAQHRDLLVGEEAAVKDAILAELFADRLQKPVEALAAAKRALDGGAEPGALIPVLQRLVEVSEVRGEAARILSEQYEAGGDSRQEADAVRALISETSNPPERVELYKKLADIFEDKLKEPGAALSVIVEALSAYPGEIDLWDRAVPLATQSGRPTDLSEAFRTALRRDLPDGLALDLARRAVILHETSLDDPQGAVPYYERILAIDPDDDSAFTRLRAVLTAGERWRELEELYGAEIQRLGDDVRSVEMLAEVALLAEDIMGDAVRAVDYHKQILAIDPQTSVSLEALDRLYTRMDNKEELLKILHTRAELAVGAAQHAHLVRVAQVAISQHIPETAVQAIEQVLSEDPSNYESRDIAEELILIGSVKARAAKALELVYESKDEIRDLVRVLGVRVESLRPREGEELNESEVNEREDERRELLRRIATLRDDRLHDDEGSFDVFAELSPLDPDDSDLRERLVDSGRRLGRGAKVVEVLVAGAKSATAPEVRAEILLEAATVQSDLLNDSESAKETLLQVLALRDDVPHVALLAARAIEPILATTDNYKEIGENLRHQVDLEDDPERKVELLARLARLYSDLLGDNDAAIAAWEERVAENSDDTEALRNLTELYEKAQRYEDVARVLAQRREVTSDEHERSSLARHLADVQEQHLGETDKAIESFQAILDESGPNSEVLAALGRLYKKSERWDDLAEIFERQIETVESDEERLSALASLGKLKAGPLNDVSGALETYRRALASDMGHAPSRDALNALLSHELPEARFEAAQILEPIYEAEGDSRKLLLVLIAQAESTEDPTDQATRYEAAMRIAESSLSDVARAMELAVLGARAAAGHADMEIWVESLERLAPAASARAVQVQILSEIVSDIFDPDLQLRIQRRIAEIKRDDLQDLPGAIVAYRTALEFRADDEQSLLALENLFGKAGDHDALLGILDARLEVALDDEARKEISFRRARLLSEEIGNKEGAIEAYEQILDLVLDPVAIAALERLYVETERFDDLVTLIQRRIDESGSDTADLRVDLARVAAEKQGDVERGLDEVEQAPFSNGSKTRSTMHRS
jgi:tetratricopeptide (TPR) repeat protein